MQPEQPNDKFCFTGTKAYDQLVEATSLYIACQSALLDDCCNPGGSERDRAEELAISTRGYPGLLDKYRFNWNDYDAAEINRRFRYAWSRRHSRHASDTATHLSKPLRHAAVGVEADQS